MIINVNTLKWLTVSTGLYRAEATEATLRLTDGKVQEKLAFEAIHLQDSSTTVANDAGNQAKMDDWLTGSATCTAMQINIAGTTRRCIVQLAHQA